MTTDHQNISTRRLLTARRLTAVAIALFTLTSGWLAGEVPGSPLSSSRADAQLGGVRYTADYQVLFEFTQTDLGVSSVDQISVIFSNRSVEGPKAPPLIFGEDIVQEFSFSALDFSKGSLRFSRRVRDKSFVDARYIRVVNHGTNGWMGDKISLTVDGEVIMRGVAMFPRRTSKGETGRGGIGNFNPREWNDRSYWEKELQPYRSASRK
jgi:hypothetical protein